MPPTLARIEPNEGDALLLVGTTKGAFVLRAPPSRSEWEVSGPHFPGHVVYAMAFDDRAGRRRVWAAAENPFWGTALRHSDDFGATWTEPTEPNVRFPAGSDAALKQIWQIHLPPDDADRMLCGVEPAMLFESTDAGASWTPSEGLMRHPHRDHWEPGAGGLCLHTIVTDPADPDRVLVAISTAGVYRTDDGGRSWRARNQGIRAVYLPDQHPEFGQCVHKVVHHPARPERLFLQNHWGLYRSDDWGDSWHDIANGVPSDFGFAMAMHPHDPDTVYIVPIESDQFRCVPEGKMRVYRTRDAGESWHPLAEGLPQEHAFETVLRDGMATDALDRPGVYFGTRSGKLFASSDEGDSWALVTDGLPPVTFVRSAIV